MKAMYGMMITLLLAVVGCGTLSKGTLAVKEQVVGNVPEADISALLDKLV